MDARDAQLSAVLTDVAFCQVVQRLRGARIPVAPLKGILWRKTLYAGEEHLRPLIDVDLLVPAHLFAAAQRVLLAAGMRPLTPAGDPRERTFVDPALPVQADLHAHLFPSGRYRLPTAELFARARPDRTLFSEPVWVLDPIDQLLHLLGHFVTAHLPPSPRYQGDLARLVRHHAPSPADLAARAGQSGMRRTVALGLRQLQTPEVADFVARTERALRLSAVDRATVAGSRALLRRAPPRSATAALTAHLCGRSLATAPLTLLTAWAHRRGNTDPT